MSKHLLCLVILIPIISRAAHWLRFEINRTQAAAISEAAWQTFQYRNRNKTINSHHATVFRSEEPLPPEALLPPHQMLFLLGPKFFNPHLLSLSKPWERVLYPQGRLVFPKNQSTSFNEIKDRVDILRLYKHKISVRRIDRMSGIYTACPLLQIWRDYGDHYWPRWVKDGRCVNLGGSSCSLPPGMFCSGHRETTVVLLRYVCPRNADRSHCNWYRMQKPILTSCKCGCR
uniref:Noggin n=1 Tax=Mesocestoides corti TaxID=53468 RepID=A0A5K3F594_MESCO